MVIHIRKDGTRGDITGVVVGKEDVPQLYTLINSVRKGKANENKVLDREHHRIARGDRNRRSDGSE